MQQYQVTLHQRSVPSFDAASSGAEAESAIFMAPACGPRTFRSDVRGGTTVWARRNTRAGHIWAFCSLVESESNSNQAKQAGLGSAPTSLASHAGSQPLRSPNAAAAVRPAATRRICQTLPRCLSWFVPNPPTRAVASARRGFVSTSHAPFRLDSTCRAIFCLNCFCGLAFRDYTD
jgi:hypothetical protein